MLCAKDIINALMDSGACAAGCCEAEKKMYIGEVKGYHSVFCAAFPYLSEDDSNGRISKYALGLDYHKVLTERIRACLPETEHVLDVFSDVSPFREVIVAEACGIGKRGKNNLIAVEGYGSFVFLACIGSDIEPEPICACAVPDCNSCMACVRACPTGALCIENGEVRYDIDLCLSHISQKKGELSEYELRLLKENHVVWGCDRCQDACPRNTGAKQTYLGEFSSHPHYPLTSSELKDMSNRQFKEVYKNRAFSWRGVAVFRRNLENLE